MTRGLLSWPGWRFVVPAILMLAAVPAAADGAADIYGFYCAQCHGTGGNGKGINAEAPGLSVTPRDHTSAVEMSKLTDETLKRAIADGGDAVAKSEIMPPWRGVLSQTEITELVAYLRHLCACRGPAVRAKP